MAIQSSTTPQEEATLLLSQVISELTTPSHDLKTILRKCQHICELLDWQQQLHWFHQELNGYPSNAELPFYRKISGIRKWNITESGHDFAAWMAESMVRGIDSAVYEEEAEALNVWANIDWFISAAKNGYKERLPETKIVTFSHGRERITMYRDRIFLAGSFTDRLAQFEAQVFHFASKSYVQLKYGNLITDIWSGYRSVVDAQLTQLQFSNHLQAIQSGFQTNNPEAWRASVFACRSLFTDLANYLWQNPRPRYEYLPGRTDDGKLDVTQGNTKNRIAAYLHQKGLSGTEGRHLRNEAERLVASIDSIVSFQSAAHDPINLQNAKSIAISTYILVGEIVFRTDLVPVKEYGNPTIELE
jgi:AbiTii-like protein